MNYITYLFLFLLILLPVHGSFAGEVPYTLEDRDRLIRVEAKVEQIDKRLDQVDKRFEQIDKRFEQVDKRFEQIDKRFEMVDSRIGRLESVMMWGFGLLFTTMVGLVGFVLWDRRTALAPAIKESKELREREERIERALREFAEKEPRLAEALRHANLMS